MYRMFLAYILFYFLFNVATDAYAMKNTGNVIVVSLSSDGKYAVSSNAGNKIILWDIANKKASVISANANIYSAYFVKNTHYFLWQDLSNIVHVEDISGHQVMSFQSFPSYGEIMTSDLKHYFASDINWSVYAETANHQYLMHNDFNTHSFIGAEKLLNMTLSNNNKLLLLSGACFNSDYDQLPLSAGKDAFGAKIIKIKTPTNNFSLLDSLSLWDVNNRNILFKLPGHNGKIIGTISPDGRYIVSADENTDTYIWNALTGKKIMKLDDLVMGHPIRPNILYDPNSPALSWDKDNLIPVPKDFNASLLNAVYAVKFIDEKGYYLRFITYRPYAILYNINNPRPIKYFPLGTIPMPSINDYTRDEGIDSAPHARILVVAKDNGTGIIVYQYDPIMQTLQKIWSPEAPK